MATSVMTDLTEVVRPRSTPQQQEARSATRILRLAEIFARVAWGVRFFRRWRTDSDRGELRPQECVVRRLRAFSCSTPGW
jgi:hypothetical protein